MAIDNGQGHVKTNINQFIKSYSVYDLSFRVTDIYEVATDAVDGTPCFHTHYVYDGASTRILKTKEGPGVWVSATMDI